MDIKVSELFVNYIERLGAEYVFGIPGAHILPLYDAIYNSPIKSVLAKHEQGASFMAGGYAQVSGKPGVCIATAGPGATNLVTGLANAYMDNLPVLALTGETPTYSFGKGALQESSGEGSCINQHDLFRGITKYNSLLQRTDYLLTVLRKTTGILLSKNPGPVLLSLPYNVLKETVDGSLLDNINFDPGYPLSETLLPADAMVSLINNAVHPVVIAGYGTIASDAEQAISDFCVKSNIPVATTLKARGVLSETSDLSLGVLGITSNEPAFRYITEKADLLIIAGASFGERTSYNWNNELIKGKKIIQIDNNRNCLNKVFTADIALDADVKKVFSRLNEKVRTHIINPKDPKEVKTCKSKYLSQDTKDNGFMLVSNFLNMLNDYFNGDVLIFDDNIIYMQRFCHVLKSRSYFPNSGISSLGHAVPAAIGAKLAAEKPVIAILGDGGFQMCCMEIMTAVNCNIPITIILLNNASLGLVRKNQFYNYAGRFIASEFINPDYRKLAEAFNIEYFRVASQAEAEGVFQTADFMDKINLVELILDKDEFPQYSSGR
ncbi:MAG: acetolactate synthase [Nitrospira bacterium HGW-Nitrospira-1]|nr:MAG: acetolactate synthase [Nitrospira bacterium HGW-Nitrospira-1]